MNRRTINNDKDFQMVFVVGCYRSGTTLIRNLLDIHQRVAVTSEIHFFDIIMGSRKKFGDIANDKQRERFVDYILRKVAKFSKTKGDYWQTADINYQELRDDLLNCRDIKEVFLVLAKLTATKDNFEILVEKTPINVFFLKEIMNIFPNARIINIVRDGRDVCASACKLWSLDYLLPIARWIESLRRFDNDRHNLSDLDFFEVKYEDLVDNPEEEMKKIFNFIGINTLPDNFKYSIETVMGTSSFQKGQKGLYKSSHFESFFNNDEREIINYFLHPLLEKRGYESRAGGQVLVATQFRFFYNLIKMKIFIFLKKAGYFWFYTRLRKMRCKLSR